MNPQFRKKILPQLLATMLVPGVAFAEEAKKELETISVTANKMEEDLEKVPQSITVIDEFQLEDKGIQTVPDLIEKIPNMNLSTNGGSNVGFRGLTQSVFSQSNPVVIYIDGVPTNKSYGFDASMANVERIEVLRGPQGTLYGKDAIGAIINIITKEPTDEWQGHIGAEVGNQNSRYVTLNASGPIVEDTLFMGINGQINKDDGWIENTYPGLDKHANVTEDSKVGAYLLFKPNERLSAKLNISHDTKESNWYDGYVVPPQTDMTTGQQTFATSQSDFDRGDAEKLEYDVDQNEEITTDSQSLNVSYDFDDFALESVTVHKKVEVDGVYDLDFGANPMMAGLTQFNGQDSTVWSQELRLSSKNTEGTRWVTGLYLESEDVEQAPYGWQFPFFVDTDGDQIPETFSGNFEQNIESMIDTSNRALFGQVMLPIRDDMELTLGLRAQTYTSKMDLKGYFYPVGSSPSAQNFTNGYKDSTTWNSILPKAAIRYTVDDNFNVYASYSKGYLPGGYNTFASGGTGEENLYEPQQSNNYEVGVKGRLSDLTFAANIFYMDIKDTHVYRYQGSIYYTDNADKSHSQGIELEFNWFATNNLEISGSLGLISAKYDDYNDGTDFSGENIIETPSHTATLSAAYNSPDDWYSRIDINNFGETSYFDAVNKDVLAIDGYTTVDMKLGYRMDDLNIYAYAYNLTDEEYIQGLMSNQIIGTLVTFGTPRTFGVGAKYNF